MTGLQLVVLMTWFVPASFTGKGDLEDLNT